MPLTTLDPDTALIVIDLQKGIVGGNFIHPIGEIIDRTRRLIDVFRANGLPVVLVNVTGRAPGRTEQGARSSVSFAEGWADLLPELNQQRAISSSPSGAGARSQRRTLRSNSRRAALRRWL